MSLLQRVSRKLSLIAFSLLIVVLILEVFYTPVSAAPRTNKETHRNASPHAVPTTTITGNPLTIQIGADGSFQVENALDPNGPTGGQFYPGQANPSDAGIFLTTANKAYGPDFVNHTDGSASNTYDLYTQVSQSAVTGSGTSSSPYTQVTVLDVPNTSIRITQTTTYVNSALNFSQSWAFSNNGNGQPSPSFNYFYAGDIYFQGSDLGYGYYDPGSGAVGGTNQTNTAFILFVPTTRADAYFEGHYHDVWDRIGSAGAPGIGFDDSVLLTDYIDNGAGVQWNNRTVGVTLSSIIQIGTGAPPTPQPYTYYLPFLAKSAGGFSTYVAFQNTSGNTANIHIYYYDVNGANFANDTSTCPTLAAHAECLPPGDAFTPGTKGAGIITSDQLLNVVVAESTPYGGSAYTVNQGASNSSVAPLAIKGAINFITQINIFNGSSTSTTATVKFYSQNGTHVTGADKSVPIAAHTTATLDQSTDGTLPSGFYGWAQVTAPTGSQIVVQVLEQRPDAHFVAVASGSPTPSSTLYAPIVFNNSFGFVSGANIINPNSTPVNVTLTYYKPDGTAVPTSTFTIGANSITLVYQPSPTGPGIPTGGLPVNFYGSAIVNSSGGPVVMVVNEAGGLTSSGGAQSGTYAAALNGGSNVGLPVTAHGGFGYTTGATLVNTSGSVVSGSLQFYQTNGTAVGSAQPFTLQPHSSILQYQGSSTAGLPTDFYGTALATITSGPASSVIATVNAQSASFFYTYTEPNQ